MEYSLLKDPQEWALFSQSRQGTANGLSGLWESHVGVKGMHCAACSVIVEQALLKISGVLSANVSAAGGRACIVWSDEVTTPAEWFAAIFRLGYELSPNVNGLTSAQRTGENRLALWRWLVAGFCMMQVMMYALPAYIADSNDITPDLTQLLRWASWVLSLPVMIFSSAPFFRNAFRDLRHRSISMDLPVALGIAITFALSSAATFNPNAWWGHSVYFDSLTMFVFFLLTGRLLEQRLKNSADEALSSMSQALPTSVVKQQADGTFESIPISKLHLGDIIKVIAADRFPVDGKIVLGASAADESLITGESRPVKKVLGDSVIAGSFNTLAIVHVCTEKLGADTTYARVLRLIDTASMEKPDLVVLADKVAKPFLIFVLLAALSSAGFWWATDPAKALMAAVAVLIVTCPCALSLAAPVAMLNTASAFAKKRILIRRLQSIEALADIDTVIFDKTGTLTEASLTLTLGSVHYKKGITLERALTVAAQLARNSHHPIAVAITRAFQNQFAAVDPDNPVFMNCNMQEYPGQGIESTDVSDDYPEFTGKIRLGSAEYCQVIANPSEAPQAFLSDDNGFIAQFNLSEAIRPAAQSVIQRLKERLLDIQILSGDKKASVKRIAQQLHLSNAFGEHTPAEKLAHVLSLQTNSRKVLMIGDGMNDAPVLAAANVSIALGHAVQITQAKSDFIVPNNQLILLPEMIQKAKKTMTVIRQNLLWAALYNAICIPLAVTGMLPAWLAGLGMAASSLLVIINSARLTKSL
jgi:P-type Cu2+ transporter